MTLDLLYTIRLRLRKGKGDQAYEQEHQILVPLSLTNRMLSGFFNGPATAC